MAQSINHQAHHSRDNFPIVSKTYIHHFRYTISKDLQPQIKDTLFITSNYDKITGVTPTQIIPQDQSILYIKVVTTQEIVHTAKTTLELKKFGLTLKLNSTQMDKNTIFCNSGPALMANINKERIMEELTTTNPNLTILDVYVIPPKNIQQKLVSFKVTLLTQQMVSDALEKGLKAYGHFLDSSKISRAKQLTKTQCSKCNSIGHGASKCKGQMVCPHCAGNHSIKDCNNKADPPLCSNCGGNHRATSNSCSYKKKYLSIPPSNNIVTQYFKNPESNYSYPAPPPTTNPWFNRNNLNDSNISNNSTQQNNNNQFNFTTLSPTRGKSVHRPTPHQINNQNITPSTSSDTSYQFPIPPPLINNHNSSNQNITGAIPKNPSPTSNSNNNNTFHNVTESGNNVYISNVQPNPKPIISYNECLIMAKQFEDWPSAFTELQFAFGISPVIAIPTSLHNKMKFVDCITPNTNPMVPHSSHHLSPSTLQINQNTNNNNPNLSQSKPIHNANSNNTLQMANSINNLIKSGRELKNNENLSNSACSSTILNNKNSIHSSSGKTEDADRKDTKTPFKNTHVLKNYKKANNSKPLESIHENVEFNSSSSSIDGELLICENSFSSLSSNDDNIVENLPLSSSPINEGMGSRTRSKTNLSNSTEKPSNNNNINQS